MFNFLKKDMVSALHRVSKSLQNHTLKFTPEETKRLIESPLFKAIDTAYEAENLSPYGGLAWFMNQAIDLTIAEMKSGKQLSTPSQRIFYKLSHYAVVLDKQNAALKAQRNDLTVIEEAAKTANQFVELSIETQTC